MRSRLNPAVASRFSIALRPEQIYRLLGYGGLALLAVIQLGTGGGWPAAVLLLVTLIWPVFWWRLSPRTPALRNAGARGAIVAHSVECLAVLCLVHASGAAEWLLLAVGLLGLTGVTALGGPRMLFPCASVLFGGYLMLAPWPPDPGGIGALDGASMAGGGLVTVCLLGLAWQAHLQARRLNAGRRAAVRESSELRDHNDRLARYLPEGLPPATRAEPAALQLPREVFVTVAFVDLAGFAELVAGHSISEVVDVLNDFMATISRLTAAEGGVLGKFLGDGVLVYFPEARPPSETGGVSRLRVRAASGCARLARVLEPEMRARARAWQERGLGLRLTSRVGIASGYCALGDWGGQGRLDYTLIGTPVNLASRLQAAAAPGAALLSGTAASLIGQDPDLAEFVGEPRTLEIRGMGAVVVHELCGSAKVRAIPLPVRSGRPDA